jgi:G3E family GTPase
MPMSMGSVPLAAILDTGRFDLERAAQAPRWLKEMRGEHVAETQEYGIASTTYLARRPFHPQRFHDFLNREWSNGRLLRSKGYFWLASRPQEAGSWSQAGGLMRYDYAGRWWRFTPEAQWPEDDDSLASIRSKWNEDFGDCRQELVFIGQNIDFARLRSDLDGCLLSDTEWNLGPEHWLRLADPFGAWHQEVA